MLVDNVKALEVDVDDKDVLVDEVEHDEVEVDETCKFKRLTCLKKMLKWMMSVWIRSLWIMLWRRMSMRKSSWLTAVDL